MTPAFGKGVGLGPPVFTPLSCPTHTRRPTPLFGGKLIGAQGVKRAILLVLVSAIRIVRSEVAGNLSLSAASSDAGKSLGYQPMPLLGADHCRGP